jgi:hypothetical protein
MLVTLRLAIEIATSDYSLRLRFERRHGTRAISVHFRQPTCRDCCRPTYAAIS